MRTLWLYIQRLIDKLGGRVIATLIGAMALSLFAVVIADSWIVSLAKTADQIYKVRNNISSLYQVRHNLTAAESAQRGYVITQKAEYLKLYEESVQNARLNLRSIDELSLPDAKPMSRKLEQDWQLAISGAMEAKIAEMKLTVSLVLADRVQDARQVTYVDQGRLEMVKFNDNINKLIDLQQSALKKMVQKRTTNIQLTRAAIISTSLILLFLVILVIRQLLTEMAMRDQLRQRLVEELHTYETQLKSRTQLLRTLALGYQSDVEREREKLARELHDELGSILTATKMDVSWAMRKIRDIAPEINEKLTKTLRYLDQGIQFKRQVVQELHPSMIATFGFWTALRSLIEDMADRNQWQLSLVLPDDSTRLSETISLIAYRVVQETLNNASKYAQASNVSIYIITELEFLKIEIEDNGVGADLSATGGTTHGLSGMRHRVMAIGGHLEIESSPGHGMMTRALIPLNVSTE